MFAFTRRADGRASERAAEMRIGRAALAQRTGAGRKVGQRCPSAPPTLQSRSNLEVGSMKRRAETARPASFLPLPSRPAFYNFGGGLSDGW